MVKYSHSKFFEYLERLNYNSEQIALIWNDTYLSYKNILEFCKVSKFDINFKSLIFIHSSSPLEIAKRYLWCLYNNHLPYIASKKLNKSDELIVNFMPNVIWDDNGFSIFNNKDLNINVDLAFLLSTSGSTGMSKLVKISWTSIAANTKCIIDYLKINSDSVACCPLDLSYSFGLSVLNTHLISKSPTVFLNWNSSTVPTLAKIINDNKVTHFYGVPEIFRNLNNYFPDLVKLDSVSHFLQAGGKLDPNTISSYVDLCLCNSKEFFVMYGQTEASPRISYATTNFLANQADTIGKALYGGRLKLDCNDYPNGIGELIYKGPNIMSGYAFQSSDLAQNENISLLRTGDIAREINGSKHFQIVGRKNREVKIFSKRINLDHVEVSFNKRFNIITYHKVDGNKLLVFIDSKLNNINYLDAKVFLSKMLEIPMKSIIILNLKEVPLLQNGKVNYKKINEKISLFDFKTILSILVQNISEYFTKISFNTIKEAFEYNFNKTVSESDTFNSLGGDSLTFVNLEISLLDLKSTLPKNWQSISIRDLENV